MYRMLIDGELIAANITRDVISPVDESVIASVPEADVALMDRAIAAARQAWPAWRAQPFETRSKLLQSLSAIIADHGAELAALLIRETGRPQSVAQFELGLCRQYLDYYARQRLDPEVLIDEPERRVEVHRQPLGVVGAVVPWNAPLYIAIGKIAPALIAGNTIVLKPAPTTPIATLRLAELIAEVVPAGVVNIVPGSNETGAHLVSHPDVNKVTFTGSTATGRAIMAAVAPTLKPLTLELGGNDAAIVLPDADVDAVVPGLFAFSFFNSGQVCAIIKRLYVHDSLYDAVCNKFAAMARGAKLGDGADPDTQFGPVQNKAQFAKVQEFLADAKANGQVVAGGDVPSGPGYFVPLTVVRDVAEGTRIVDEEPFGPVLPIIRYSDVEDAVQRANASPYGLGASVWSADVERATRIAERLQAGSVWVNQHCALDPAVPFPAHKQSGLGIEGGREGLYAYTHYQVINIAKPAAS